MPQSWVYEHTIAALDVTLEHLGTQLVVCVSGGSTPHIGSVTLASPRPSLTGAGTSATSSVLNLPGHKDEAIGRPLAELLAARFGTTVCCICGIHIDDATPEDIASCETLGHDIATFLIEELATSN